MTERTDRLNEVIRQALGRFILREIELPPSSLATITRVETTPDLKVAKVYITVTPDKFRGTILELLKKNSRQLHELLKKELFTKFTPNLQFFVDEQEIFANKVEQILDEINKG